MTSTHFHNHLGSELGVLPSGDGGDGNGGGGNARGHYDGSGGEGGNGGSVSSDRRRDDGSRGDGRVGVVLMVWMNNDSRCW